jgi:hypothetical protein
MFLLAAILSFALAIIFYAWNISHDVFTWTLFMLIGLFCWCISGASWPPWK